MPELAWQKSTFSEPGSDTCVEVAVDPHPPPPRERHPGRQQHWMGLVMSAGPVGLL
ncbi:DUF397 domain-containing protein [Streptomyces himalayensis]|uniref:DUF397 domain-containing protein n=1 Tax=Streptomyces himalayensis subsp. himalayensis TaxID=2756131 RepID=A0A7W0DH80_9ACTN|nr:DUF397 domain-containing protein [Streptomyces himalayensis subsp. himalayensis]